MNDRAVMNDRPWPTGRGSESAFTERFGRERAQRFRTAFHEGDPVADALFASSSSRAGLMRSLRAALETGTPEPDAPPEVTAFVDDMRSALDGVDWERVRRGQRVYLSIPVLAHTAALGPGSLTHTYSSPAISTVLVGTGRLVDGALRRLLDTRNWTYHLYADGSLRPGEPGFQHTGMVRAMHAFSRDRHLAAGGGTDEYGVPINAIDMLRTWFDFTYVPYRGLHAMGYELSEDQIRDIYYLWQVVGRMLGIPADLLAGLDDHASSEESVQAIAAVAGTPDEGSKALVDALIDASAAQLAIVLELPEQPLRERTEAQLRIIHGDELADALGVPRRSIQVAEMMQVPLVRQRFAFLQRLPDELEKEIATNEATIGALLQATDDGQSAYETAPAAGG